MFDHISYFKNVKKKAIENGQFQSDQIDFYNNIFNHLNKYYNLFIDSSHAQSITLLKEMPLLKPDNILFNEKDTLLLIESLLGIKSIIEKFHNGINLEYLITSIQNDKILLNDYTKLLFNHDIEKLTVISKEIKIGIDEFIFIIVNCVKPLFIYLMDMKKEEINHSEWFSSSCPFCGYYPDIAKIVDSMEGKRFLHCALCEHEWPFERLSCTICDNTNTEKLGYYVTEEETPYRIDYCEICKGYIKTLKFSRIQDHNKYDLYVENIITPHLDYLAQEKGYLRQ